MPFAILELLSSILLSSSFAISSSFFLSSSSLDFANTVLCMLSYFIRIFRNVPLTSLFSSSPNSHDGITLFGSSKVLLGTKLYCACQSSSLKSNHQHVNNIWILAVSLRGTRHFSSLKINLLILLSLDGAHHLIAWWDKHSCAWSSHSSWLCRLSLL